VKTIYRADAKKSEPGGVDLITESGLNDYLFDAINQGASDLHITVGIPPSIRINGQVQPLDYPPMTPTTTREMIYDILSNDQRQRLESEWELDFAYTLPRTARFRVNIYFQRGSMGAAFRAIPHDIKSFKELKLPQAIEDMTDKPRGLVLVTGPTGSGKSTTLASMIDKINETRRQHIMSVEDPIEFLHTHKSCIVNQREVNQDTKSFAQALKHVLRQDPDVILVGEMRDLETIQLAISAAETGHLVFGTLHTQDAPQTVDRIIDVFPSHQHPRSGLSSRTLCKGSSLKLCCRSVTEKAGSLRARYSFLRRVCATLFEKAKTIRSTPPCRPVASSGCRRWTQP
jgi:twitching motility protein PilT